MDGACVTQRSGPEPLDLLHADHEAGPGPQLSSGEPGAGPRSRLGSLAAPLAFREFRLLFAGQTISLIGSGAAPVALSFALLQSTGSVAIIGFALTAQIVPVLAFLLIGGVWADRLPRQRVMLWSDVVRFGVQAALGTLLVTGHLQLVTLLALQAIKGVAEAFFTPASGGLVPLTVDREHLQQANALRGIAQSVGSLGGPVLGGLLVATVGAGWALQVNGATYLASALFLAAMHPKAQDRVRRTAGALHDLREGWRAIRQRSFLSVVIVQNTLFMTFAVAPTFVLGPLAAASGFGGARAWGVILGSMGAGELLGGLGALTLRPSRALLSGCVLTPLYGLFLAVADDPDGAGRRVRRGRRRGVRRRLLRRGLVCRHAETRSRRRPLASDLVRRLRVAGRPAAGLPAGAAAEPPARPRRRAAALRRHDGRRGRVRRRRALGPPPRRRHPGRRCDDLARPRQRRGRALRLRLERSATHVFPHVVVAGNACILA